MKENIELLKQELIKTNCFDDNNYLDLYCSLIYENRNRKKEKYKTQKHHIIPKCYYKLNNLDINNDDNNLVNLYFKDHILAHYYLCLCVNKNEKLLKFHFENGFLHLVKSREKLIDIKIDELIYELDNYQFLYEDFRKINSKLHIGIKLSEETKEKLRKIKRGELHIWNKGLTVKTDERMKRLIENRHYSKETLLKLSNSLKEYYKNHENNFKNKKHSEESKLKMKLVQSHRVRVEVYDSNWRYIKTFDTLKDCQKELKIKPYIINLAYINKSLVKEKYYFKLYNSQTNEPYINPGRRGSKK